MNEDERRFKDRLSAIDALLDDIADTLSEDYVIESFTTLNNEWLKTKLNDITTEENELYIV